MQKVGLLWQSVILCEFRMLGMCQLTGAIYHYKGSTVWRLLSPLQPLMWQLTCHPRTGKRPKSPECFTIGMAYQISRIS